MKQVKITRIKLKINGAWISNWYLPIFTEEMQKNRKSVLSEAHFLAVLSWLAPDFPQFLWDLFLVQTEITLNFLRQSTFNRTISAWEYFSVPFQYYATPLGTLGMNFIIHKKSSRCHSWDFRGKVGWSVGAAMDHY